MKRYLLSTSLGFRNGDHARAQGTLLSGWVVREVALLVLLDKVVVVFTPRRVGGVVPDHDCRNSVTSWSLPLRSNPSHLGAVVSARLSNLFDFHPPFACL
ncbi:unnamed protein product [Rangifer tarandus platyrhynchus]|uniref:Uncharacterized protein n=2 Tax=Rangifer tarandus platyrhynchus TaxID=3082113 RepID=A0AC59Z390_RANTA|nr:unnamed protein product [Rangifer tarandus platyrhynchus]